MLKRITRWIADKTEGQCDRTLRAQADHVRQIAQKFRLSIFPEHLSDTQNCSVCNEPNLMLVHPDMICHSCLIDVFRHAHNEVFGVQIN